MQVEVLDELGAVSGAACLSSTNEFVVARQEAVYLYTMDGRGPCFVFDGLFCFSPLRPHTLLGVQT